jgi:hypothetical protein
MNDLSKVIPKHVIGKFAATQAKSMENLTNIARDKCNKKFEKLVKQQNATFQPNDSNMEQNILNFTDVEIPPEVETLLGLGPKFALVSRPSEVSRAVERA